MAADYDSPWKEALDAYFDPFLALLFPEVHAQVKLLDFAAKETELEASDNPFSKIVLEAILQALETAPTLEDVRRLCSPTADK